MYKLVNVSKTAYALSQGFCLYNQFLKVRNGRFKIQACKRDKSDQ